MAQDISDNADKCENVNLNYKMGEDVVIMWIKKCLSTTVFAKFQDKYNDSVKQWFQQSSVQLLLRTNSCSKK